MSLATPEAWYRLLMRARRWGGTVAFVSVVLSVGASVWTFLMTLPERLVLWVILRRRFGEPAQFAHEPGTVVILGYYRSGTTHLHNLLSCDRRMVTPRWVQALAPHGFFASWTVLSWILTPLLANTRPQDGVGFGPAWPAEDDFAMCNWALASSLPGRLIFPSQFAHFSRWQFMDELSERELSRWRRHMAAFCWKVTRPHPKRMLLLKSPSHTSRAAQLRRLFDDNVRFIVIERDREEIITSHAFMSQRLSRFTLEPLPPEDELRRTYAQDFDRSVEAMERDLEDVPASRVARIQFEDLRADAIGEIRRAYAEIGLVWNDAFERRLIDYQRREGAYEPRHAKAIERPDAKPIRISIGRRIGALGVGAGVTGAFLALWLVAAGWIGERLDFAGWALGFAVGLSAVHVARIGDRWLGAAAALLCLAALVVAHYLLPEVVYGWVEEHRWMAMRKSFNSPREATLGLLGLVTAYRVREPSPHPPAGVICQIGRAGPASACRGGLWGS